MESERLGLGAGAAMDSERGLVGILLASSSYCLPAPGKALYGFRSRSILMGAEEGGMGGLVSSMADSAGIFE